MEGLGDFWVRPRCLGIASFSDIFWERSVVEGANSDIFFHISGIVKRTLVSRKDNAASNSVAGAQLPPIVAVWEYRPHLV